MKLFDVHLSESGNGRFDVALSGEIDLSTVEELQEAPEGRPRRRATLAGAGPARGVVPRLQRAADDPAPQQAPAATAGGWCWCGRAARGARLRDDRRRERLEQVADPSEVDA